MNEDGYFRKLYERMDTVGEPNSIADAFWKLESFAEQIVEMQNLIEDGSVWLLDEKLGTMALDLINSGHCTLGRAISRDQWGNAIPSRDMVEAGTIGSVGYAKQKREGVDDEEFIHEKSVSHVEEKITWKLRIEA